MLVAAPAGPALCDNDACVRLREAAGAERCRAVGREGAPAVAARKVLAYLRNAPARRGPNPRPGGEEGYHHRRHVLPGEELHAEHLRIGVAAVPRRAESLFVC